ncbi:hypothetical protein Tco_1468570 [Tanacetum coccineum]
MVGKRKKSDASSSCMSTNQVEDDTTAKSITRLHGNAAGMPYDVSETRGNGETRETPGKRPQEKGKRFYNYGTRILI